MNTLLKILAAPWRATSQAAQGFLSLTLAARIAWAVALLQVFVVLMTLVVIFTTGGAAVFEAWWTPSKALALLLLLAVVPLLVYWSARLWFQHDTARWPDIDKAWREALVELDRQGIELASTPLFLVLGCDGGPREAELFTAAPVSFDVRAAPQGSAPLHVYAGPEGIFVCLATIGQTCKLMAQTAASTEQPTASLRSAERSDASDRLRTICDRIRHARRPVAPANGVIALVPAVNPDQQRLAPAAGSALSEDLLTLSSSCGLRMPLTVVGTGIDQIPGFETLLQRLPSDLASLPLGESYPVGRTASPEEIGTLAVEACGRLADVIGGILLDPKSLALSAENRRLVGLACRLRLDVAPLLQGIMQRGLDYAAHSGGTPFLAGCYLLPATRGSTQVSMSDGLFSRVLEVQGDLEWTSDSLNRNRRYGRIAQGLMLLNVVMLSAWLGIIWWRVSR